MISAVYRDRLDALLAGGGRKMLGIAGAPGSGKSTLAQAMLEHVGEHAVIVPMDGFHLANAELARLGRASRKGAEDTFDSAGYVHLLERLKRRRDGETVYAPAFHRDIEEAVAGAIPVSSGTQLIITEGNYLLLDRGHWSRVQPLLDEVWYVDVDHDLRRERLIARHQQYGRERAQAEAWVRDSDEPNAELIESTRSRAHLIFRWE
ncbi:nucleoside/nucleotide kinase family protein [Herbaspirillum robiniae]|uniref:Nucleoside/nucleotide kinase family protein n=1 Tax=Herbaspirillum robiniae TaxID=2014887 RepID=A0A246WSD8_9BURK|nr:nucleoside/nucleotide kinase family protein [Herbaspirillum robiniae]OWY29345.1 nucleoside/nucleotide kinase family protein [Herbaspirillum robiniae]